MNCSKTNGYMCIPNESFTELLEFCYDHPRILILEGKEFSRKYGPTPPLILHTHAQPHTNTHTTTHPPTFIGKAITSLKAKIIMLITIHQRIQYNVKHTYMYMSYRTSYEF